MKPIGLVIGVHQIPISTKILNLLEEKYSFKKEYEKKCLLNNKHNHVTTTYYLLFQMYERLGMLKSDEEVILLSEEDEEILMKGTQNEMINQKICFK